MLIIWEEHKLFIYVINKEQKELIRVMSKNYFV